MKYGIQLRNTRTDTLEFIANVPFDSRRAPINDSRNKQNRILWTTSVYNCKAFKLESDAARMVKQLREDNQEPSGYIFEVFSFIVMVQSVDPVAHIIPTKLAKPDAYVIRVKEFGMNAFFSFYKNGGDLPYKWGDILTAKSFASYEEAEELIDSFTTLYLKTIEQFTRLNRETADKQEYEELLKCHNVAIEAIKPMYNCTILNTNELWK